MTDVRMLCECVVPLDDLLRDDEGFVICRIHQVRRYGWRDANGRDHTKDGWTDLQVERYQLFQETPPVDSFTPLPAEQDLRDNRDPVTAIAQKSYTDDWEDAYLFNQRDPRLTEKAATDARVRLDLRDKTDWPVYDGRPFTADQENAAKAVDNFLGAMRGN